MIMWPPSFGRPFCLPLGNSFRQCMNMAVCQGFQKTPGAFATCCSTDLCNWASSPHPHPHPHPRALWSRLSTVLGAFIADTLLSRQSKCWIAWNGIKNIIGICSQLQSHSHNRLLTQDGSRALWRAGNIHFGLCCMCVYVCVVLKSIIKRQIMKLSDIFISLLLVWWIWISGEAYHLWKTSHFTCSLIMDYLLSRTYANSPHFLPSQVKISRNRDRCVLLCVGLGSQAARLASWRLGSSLVKEMKDPGAIVHYSVCKRDNSSSHTSKNL